MKNRKVNIFCFLVIMVAMFIIGVRCAQLWQNKRKLQPKPISTQQSYKLANAEFQTQRFLIFRAGSVLCKQFRIFLSRRDPSAS